MSRATGPPRLQVVKSPPRVVQVEGGSVGEGLLVYLLLLIGLLHVYPSSPEHHIRESHVATSVPACRRLYTGYLGVYAASIE